MQTVKRFLVVQSDGRPPPHGIQGERFLLIDVASEEASKRAEELLNDGWEIEAAIPI